ncbi:MULTISPECIES: hypothetical protein [Cupriavidus]
MTPNTATAKPMSNTPTVPRLTARIDTLLALDEQRQRGELTETELSEFNTSRDALFEAAGQSPLAKDLHECLQLVEILKADGAQLDAQQTALAATSLLQAGTHRIAHFAMMKSLQRTPPAAAAPGVERGDPIAGDSP